MLFLLPPSESKLDGGSVGSRLDLDALSFPDLGEARRASLARLADLSVDAERSLHALKIGPRLAHEVERNREVESSPTLRSLERYTGVLFDPVDAASLDLDAWRYATRHVVVHSALFGLLGAADRIPAYRLSHDSRLPGASLKSVWREPVSRALSASGEFVVDLRSEGYVGLGPAGPRSTYVRVVSDVNGRRRALNHFNKKSKGLFMKSLLADRPELVDLDDLIEWARGRGFTLEPGTESVLVAESVLPLAA